MTNHRRQVGLRFAGPLLLAALAWLQAVPPARGTALPTDFMEERIASGLILPTAMALAPDGRIFVCEKGGTLRVVKNGVLLATPFATFAPGTQSTRGLLGVALDPNFTANGFVYVYWTATSPSPHGRVSRLTANGDVAAAGSETTLFDLDDLTGPTDHLGGALHFGPDGKLYLAVGDDGVPGSAQALSDLLGKVLRLNPDGSIPNGNPFVNLTTGKNRAIWALGLRNPFTFAFDRVTHRMFLNDVGEDAWEEINEGLSGANYGWPATEGPHDNPAYAKPLYAYGHGTGDESGCAISGGVFYRPARLDFPQDYAGDYFFGDFCSGWIRRFDPQTRAVLPFARGIDAPIDFLVAPDGSLYYLAYGAGALFRVRYLGPPPAGNQPPVATIESPSDHSLYSGDTTISFRGFGGDSEDGDLPLSALTWEVDFVHSGQTDRVFGPVSGIAGGSFPIAATGDPSSGAFYRISLTVIDGEGAQSVRFVDVVPRLVGLTVQSAPTGLQVLLNGVARVTPFTVPAVVGVVQNLTTPSPQSLNGVAYLFQGWGDDAPSPRIFPAPPADTTYLAIYSSGDPPPPPPATGAGLAATYFNNADLTRPVYTRIDPRIDFNFGSGSPAPGVGAETFSVRWSGTVRPKVSGRHTFTTLSDEGVRLFINGRLVIDAWTAHARREDSGSIVLQAGVPYDLRLEHYERTGASEVHLSWSAPEVPREIVPAGALSPYALLLFGGGDFLTPIEASAQSQLTALGFTVILKSRVAVTAADLASKGVVVAGSAGAPTADLSALRASLVPVVTWDPRLYPVLALTGSRAGSDFGTLPAQNRLRMVQVSHPLAGGLTSGAQTVLDRPSSISYGLPASRAIVVGRELGGAKRPTLFAYERGVAMIGPRAPNRRVGLFVGDSSTARLTPEGMALLRAALRWAAGL